jgi:L-alanine-DL-glutamate epimerase-like enolase superfamily enzyme
MYCGPVAAAAAIQLDMCSPNFLIQEFNISPLQTQLLKQPIRFENGFILPPAAPGLGVELDMDVVAEHPYTPS